MKYDYEIGIIGGGPAGSTAASYLADYGFDVCLFEKKTFPRETLCGEFLSSEVIYFLKEMNLYEDFLSLNPNKISSFRIYDESCRNVGSNLNFDAYGLRRSKFDKLLLCNSIKKGVKVFQPAEVIEITRHEKYYQLKIINEEHQEIFINTGYLIAAYGKQNLLDAALSRKFVSYKSRLNGIKFHLNKNKLKNFTEDEIQLYAADNIYCGVNAVDNDLITFCFLEDRKQEQSPPRLQLIDLQKKNKIFEELFAESDTNLFTDIPIYGTGNIYFGNRKPVENGIFMIGDSAGVIAPLAGDGIGIAIESGKLIADLFSKKRKENSSDETLYTLYNSKWNKSFLKRIKTAKIIQSLILKKKGRRAGALILKLFPSLLPYLVNSTRNYYENKK